MWLWIFPILGHPFLENDSSRIPGSRSQQNPDAQKILPPTEPWNHLLLFFPTEIPPVTKTTCGDNEGNLPTLKTTKKIRKPARASRTFSHIRKELLLHLHQPSPSRSFEKMTSYVYTVSMNDLKIFHGWLGLFHPRKERSCRLLDRLSGETHQIISFFGGIFDQRWWTTTLLPRKCRISHDIHMPLDD